MPSAGAGPHGGTDPRRRGAPPPGPGAPRPPSEPAQRRPAPPPVVLADHDPRDLDDAPPLVALPDEVTLGQAADLLGVTRTTVVSLVERGDLPVRGTGARRRLPTTAVLALAERSRTGRSATLDDVIAASHDLDLYG